MNEESDEKGEIHNNVTVDESPAEVFAAINNIRGWRSGETDTLRAKFTYRYGNMHRSTQKFTELVPGSTAVRIWAAGDGRLRS